MTSGHPGIYTSLTDTTRPARPDEVEAALKVPAEILHRGELAASLDPDFIPFDPARKQNPGGKAILFVELVPADRTSLGNRTSDHSPLNAKLRALRAREDKAQADGVPRDDFGRSITRHAITRIEYLRETRSKSINENRELGRRATLSEKLAAAARIGATVERLENLSERIRTAADARRGKKILASVAAGGRARKRNFDADTARAREEVLFFKWLAEYMARGPNPSRLTAIEKFSKGLGTELGFELLGKLSFDRLRQLKPRASTDQIGGKARDAKQEGQSSVRRPCAIPAKSEVGSRKAKLASETVERPLWLDQDNFGAVLRDAGTGKEGRRADGQPGRVGEPKIGQAQPIAVRTTPVRLARGRIAETSLR